MHTAGKENTRQILFLHHFYMKFVAKTLQKCRSDLNVTENLQQQVQSNQILQTMTTSSLSGLIQFPLSNVNLLVQHLHLSCFHLNKCNLIMRDI